MTNKEKYREFCKTEKNIPIFSKDWWLDSVCGENGWDVILVEKGQEIYASLPYYKTKKVIFDIISMPKLTQTMGAYIKYPKNQKYEKKLSYEKDVINKLVEKFPKVDMFSQNFHYNFKNWLPLYWQGFEQTTKYTYVIEDLQDKSEEQLLFEFSSKYRNKIKKAKGEVVVKKNLSLDEFYNINMKTFDRQKILIPYSFDFLREHDKILSVKGRREIFYAMDAKKRIHSALYLTWGDNSSYVHMLGENPELRKSAAGVLLIWESIKHTKHVLKLDNYDFEGSILENVEKVRRNFGATQKPYFQITKINSKLLKIRKLIKEIFK